MSITEIVESEGYKKSMSKVYGWGAAVVILGALFKIQHWPGASIMLIAGLGTEALIFFLSAFEPLHEELDWTLVYPELAGLEEIDEGIGNSITKNEAELNPREELNKMLDAATLEFGKLGDGMVNFKKTIDNMSDITDATVATESYAKNVKVAASSVEKLGASYDKSATAINATSDIVSKSGENYKTLLESLNKNFQSIGSNSSAQAEQQELLTQNLSALNAVYELQLKSSNDNLQATESVSSGITNIVKDLKSTAEDVAKYKNEVAKLSTNLSALNNVYGNILTAMNVK